MNNEKLINVNYTILQSRNRKLKSFKENLHVEYIFFKF